MTKVYIVSHKDFASPIDDASIYEPLQVGTDINGRINENWYCDNVGISISIKNKSYNELTGLYWIWKNIDADIVGICHYRRFFVTPWGKIVNVIFGKQFGFIDSKYIDKKLKKKDLIVHNKTFFLSGNKNQYMKTQQYPGDMDIVEQAIKEICPEYLEAFETVMNQKKCHLLSMLIGRKKIVDEYCEWLFTLLFKVEQILVDSGEKGFERRLGMIGERMLDVWIIHNKIRIAECFTINTERRDLRIIG